MARYYEFAGQNIIKPGSYSKRVFPEDQGGGAGAGLVIIMGEAAKAGVPYDAYDDIEDVINVVKTQNEALALFGGGDIYYGAEFHLTPTKDLRFNTPGQANCIIVNQMTAAATALVASAVDIIDVTDLISGTNGNNKAIKSSSGGTVGKYIQMISQGTDLIKKDNVTLNLMSILYTGAGSPATMTINATTLATSCTSAPTDDLSITLADYSDMGSLINYINNQENYTCLLTGKSDEFANVFDAVTAVNILTTYSCVGIVEAIIRELNSSGTVLAALSTGAARTIPDDMSEFQYFTGGTVSAATTDDWVAALLKLETYNIDNIVGMTGSTAIQDIISDHITRMNHITSGKYRQAGFGSGSSTNTKALRIAQMKSLNNAYIEYCVSSFKRYDYVNKEVPATDFEPYYLYAMIAGFRYANNVGMDVVFKYLNILSVNDLGADINDYLAAGGTIVHQNRDINNKNNFEILGNNSTYQGNQVTLTNPAVVYEENRLTKYTDAWIIEQLRALDTVANDVAIATIQNNVIVALFPKFRDDFKWITNATLDDGSKQLAFSNISFYQEGEKFYLSATLTMSLTPRFAFNLLTFVVPGQKI